MNELSQNNQACVCCGGVTSAVFDAGPLDYCLDKEFEISECSNCGHGITKNVMDSDLESVYEDGAYDPKENNFHRILRPILNIQEASKLSYLIKEKRRGNSLLEVGTGKGNFLKAAINSGYDSLGIEPSSRSYSIAKSKLGDKVFQCMLEEINLHPQLNRKYDYIFLWHVLEHLKNPHNAVDILKTFLNPNGLLIIAIPNFGSFQKKYGKKNWYHLDPPRHISHFTPKSIKYLLESNSMIVKRIYFNSFFQNFLGEIVTINNLVLSNKNILLNLLRFNKFYFQKTTLLSRIINLLGFLFISSIILIPVLLFTLVSQLFGKAGTMVVLAKIKSDNNR